MPLDKGFIPCFAKDYFVYFQQRHPPSHPSPTLDIIIPDAEEEEKEASDDAMRAEREKNAIMMMLIGFYIPLRDL